MQRSRVLVHVLWSVAAASCGRLGFDTEREGSATPLPDSPAGTPVAMVAASASGQSICGAPNELISIAVANTGTGDLVIAAGSASSAFVLATTLPLTIAAGQTGSLLVDPPPGVIGTDKGGSTKTGMLTFATNEPGGGVHAVELSSTVVGANLSVATPATLSLGFSGTSGQCPPSQDIVIVNTGNAPATIGVSPVSGFAFSAFSSGMLGSGESVATLVRPFTSATCSGEGSAVYTAAGTCDSSTITVSLSFNITGSSSCFCS